MELIKHYSPHQCNQHLGKLLLWKVRTEKDVIQSAKTSFGTLNDVIEEVEIIDGLKVDIGADVGCPCVL